MNYNFGTKLSVILLVALLGVSCNFSKSDSVKNDIMPNCTGASGELIWVMEKVKWESNLGDSIRLFMMQDVDALPQPEPTLKVVQIPFDAFSDIFKTHRNIVLVRISPETEKSSVVIEHDKWSRPQVVVHINTPNETEFLEVFATYRQNLLDTFVYAEKMRYLDSYKKFPVINIENVLQNQYKMSLTIPKGYVMDVNKDNFAWISHETNKITQALLIYSYPYTDTSNFATFEMIRKRDSILALHVPGPSEGSFMTTEKRLPIHKKEFFNNGNYTCELRGLWRVEGDFMGGPFVSHSVVDTIRNRVVTVDAFVYAGKLDKRNYVWQVEAILYSLKMLP